MYTSMNTFRTTSYVWGALRRYFPEDVISTIKGITQTKDEKSAVFDVEDQHLHYFEEYMEANGERSQFSICTELPELKERSLDVPNGRGGNGGNGGGRGGFRSGSDRGNRGGGYGGNRGGGYGGNRSGGYGGNRGGGRYNDRR